MKILCLLFTIFWLLSCTPDPTPKVNLNDEKILKLVDYINNNPPPSDDIDVDGTSDIDTDGTTDIPPIDIDLDGDINEDGTQDITDITREDLPDWTIGDRLSIFLSEGGVGDDATINVDYNYGLTNGLNPEKVAKLEALYITKEAYANNDAYDISASTMSEAHPTLNYNWYINSGNNGSGGYTHMEFENNESLFTNSIPKSITSLQKQAVRISLAVEHKAISHTSGKSITVYYLWKGDFAAKSGIYELELVGYSILDQKVGDTDKFAPYNPL